MAAPLLLLQSDATSQPSACPQDAILRVQGRPYCHGRAAGTGHKVRPNPFNINHAHFRHFGGCLVLIKSSYTLRKRCQMFQGSVASPTLVNLS
ncbi:hypothetical protein GDO81_028360 [Engystomops pustulosus]|uniref:Secreted protein n=1 Tax=Engystomops pustulosus TaxID=76066 RepID=A0AAV6YKP0_ENGPU|nr:hypothetical protein GDO81_028360 [Engystomops pustulosus]